MPTISQQSPSPFNMEHREMQMSRQYSLTESQPHSATMHILYINGIVNFIIQSKHEIQTHAATESSIVSA